MCFSCPPAASPFCYVCGTTHQVPDPAPVLAPVQVQAPPAPVPAAPIQVQAPSQGTLTASRDSLSALPDDLACRVLGFIPDYAPVLPIISCRFRHIMAAFPQWHVRAVFSECPSENSPLSRHIQVLAAHHEIDIQLMPDTGTGPARPLSDCNAVLYRGILSRLSMNVHFSIVHTIRSLGVINCPNTFLAPREIVHFSEETQHAQNVNLERVWSRCLQPELQRFAPPHAALPADNAPAQEIRIWMHSDANQALLQRVTQLRLAGLDLTCVPREIALCTALQSLNLYNNQLVSLSPGLFAGLTALRELNLEKNRLVSLPPGLLAGLTALRELNLNGNRLVSLPPGFFAGLTALKNLFLQNNQIVSLPPGLFAGLTALQGLRLSNNQIVSLPPGLFAGLTALERLYLDRNRLVSLPPGLFAGLTDLEWLHLENNVLVSLPPGLFAGLTALRGLYLHANPRLLISYEDLPDTNNIGFRNVPDDFFNYECQSRLARLYQLAAGMDSPEAFRGSSAVRGLFSELPVTIKNTIYGLIWEEAGRPNTGDPQWGENHAFEDLRVFGGALKRYVRESFEKLTGDQKNAVYGRVYHLARSQRGAESARFDDPIWGEHHAQDNIPRLIDAMLLESRECGDCLT